MAQQPDFDQWASGRYLARWMVRRNLYLANRGHCTYCNRKMKLNGKIRDGDSATIDHVIPRSRGGTDAIENLVIACRRCNLRKGDAILDVDRRAFLHAQWETRS